MVVPNSLECSAELFSNAAISLFEARLTHESWSGLKYLKADSGISEAAWRAQILYLLAWKLSGIALVRGGRYRSGHGLSAGSSKVDGHIVWTVDGI